MEKNYRDKIIINNDLDIDKNHNTERKKTTDINILLNRVKIDKKKDFNKKIIFISIMIVGTLAMSAFMLV
ncbi:hypothetical protein [Candidatus Pelagibacter bacterium nBUS_36]|uniref:hypothetical protein n=1 Tax=Candidatus Pelagibacter bacterium nBUS_36 TaxID=3374194 RepID=UPI003EBC613C